MDGIQEIEAEVLATLAAVTEVGPSGASLPTTTVQAASSEVLPSEAETVLTLMRWMADKSRPEKYYVVNFEMTADFPFLLYRTIFGFQMTAISSMFAVHNNDITFCCQMTATFAYSQCLKTSKQISVTHAEFRARKTCVWSWSF